MKIKARKVRKDGSITMREPRKGEWVAVNPDPKEGRRSCLFILDKSGYYLVADNMIVDVMLRVPPKYLERRTLFVAQNELGEFFLWPVVEPVSPDHPVFAAMKGWVCRYETETVEPETVH